MTLSVLGPLDQGDLPGVKPQRYPSVSQGFDATQNPRIRATPQVGSFISVF